MNAHCLCGSHSHFNSCQQHAFRCNKKEYFSRQLRSRKNQSCEKRGSNHRCTASLSLSLSLSAHWPHIGGLVGYPEPQILSSVLALLIDHEGKSKSGQDNSISHLHSGIASPKARQSLITSCVQLFVCLAQRIARLAVLRCK